LKNCRDLPGSEVFQYIGQDGEQHKVESGDINEYLRTASGRDITAKDFRTWAATNLAVLALHKLAEKKPTNRGVVQAVKEVAQQLGNTAAVCRKSYIHPAVFDAYLQGGLQMKLASTDSKFYAPEMWAVERQVLGFLRAWLSKSATHQTLKVALRRSIKIARRPSSGAASNV
jgi:DNA topoisomerase-1